METEQSIEVIGGMKVHPAASQFPLLEGNAFHDLVSSIEEFGILHPIVLKDGMLIDGRNRLRAATKLNNQYKEENRSHRIKINSIELPSNVENVADYIFNININRRHLTPDQRVAIAEAIYPMIAEEQKTKDG
jgi:ParB-like chromosome segregation protein Spo0J